MINKEERNKKLEKNIYLNYLIIKIRSTNVRKEKDIYLDLFKFFYSKK